MEVAHISIRIHNNIVNRSEEVGREMVKSVGRGLWMV